MKSFLTIISFLISFSTFSQNEGVSYPEKRNGEVYFKFKDNVGIKWKRNKNQPINQFSFLNTIKDKYEIIEVLTPFSFTEKEIPTLDRTFKIIFENVDKTDELIRELLENDKIEFAERVAVDYKFDVPNDESLSEQWSLNIIGAFDAWDIETGSESIDVAIVDDAFDIWHEDLSGKIEKVWDIANNDGDVSPDVIEDTHGTRVAGVSGATTDNGIGMASIGRNIDLILVKHTTDGRITHGYEGILWAAENGAEIINLSWGGSTYSQARQNLINAVHDNYNVIIVAAAGNDNTGEEHYPAAYDNVIAVAATKEDDTRPDENDWGTGDGSNFGFWVDIAAPGHGIFTTRLNDEYGNSNGTSFS
ncbi:MAG: S8 family serine peptidase, partial [Balneola sp.]